METPLYRVQEKLSSNNYIPKLRGQGTENTHSNTYTHHMCVLLRCSTQISGVKPQLRMVDSILKYRAVCIHQKTAGNRSCVKGRNKAGSPQRCVDSHKV